MPIIENLCTIATHSLRDPNLSIKKKLDYIIV